MRHTHIHAHTLVHACTHVWTHVHTHSGPHILLYDCACCPGFLVSPANSNTLTHTHTHTNTHKHTHKHIYSCAHVHTHTHTCTPRSALSGFLVGPANSNTLSHNNSTFLLTDEQGEGAADASNLLMSNGGQPGHSDRPRSRRQLALSRKATQSSLEGVHVHIFLLCCTTAFKCGSLSFISAATGWLALQVSLYRS